MGQAVMTTPAIHRTEFTRLPRRSGREFRSNAAPCIATARKHRDDTPRPQYSAAVGYPENVLANDEHVVLHRHPHWGRLTLPALVLIIASAAAAFVAAYVNTLNWEQTATNIVFAVIAAIWLILVGWLTVWPFLNWWTTHFVITDRRVMYRHGLLTRSGIDIPLARINSVEFRHGLLDRIFRTGTLIIESASQDPLEFQDIPRVERVHSLLYHEVFDTMGSEEAPS